MKTRIISIILVIAFCFTLSGCYTEVDNTSLPPSESTESNSGESSENTATVGTESTDTNNTNSLNTSPAASISAGNTENSSKQSGSSNSKPAFDPTAAWGQKYNNTNFGAEGDKLYSMVMRDFWRPEVLKAYEIYGKHDQWAFLWPYGSFLQMQNAYVKLHPNDMDAKQAYINGLDALDLYYKSKRTDGLLSYSSSTTGGDIYYDDNAWIALEFITAYELLGDKKYIEKAKGICEYLYSGWDDEIGGGIWWKEGLKDDKNGFTNSPTAILSCELYNLTKDKKYLDWAVKIYNWVKRYLRQDNGLIADSIKKDFGVNHIYYTYTTGTTISAAVELYRITGDKTYLNDAKESANASVKLGTMSEENGVFIFGVDYPNWHGWLLDGFLRLHEFAPKEAKNGVMLFEYALGRAIGRARYDNGYYIVDWNSLTSSRDIDLLNQAGTARCLLDVKNYKNMSKK